MEVNNEKPLSVWVDARLASLCPDDTWQPNVDVGLARLKAMSTSGGRFNRRWIWTAAVAAAICLSLGILQSPRSLAHKCVECSLAVWKAFASVGSAQTNVQPKSTNRVSVLKPAPSVTFQTLDGRSVSLAQYRGKVVLLNFWGTWCDVCRSEIPELIKLQKEYGNRGFTVLGIAMEDKKSDVVSYVAKPQFDIDGQKVAMNYPVMLGSDEVAAKFGGFLGYPDSFVISKDGEVVEKVMGAIDADSASQLIRRLLRREGES
jgi:thiol-disulfide isomerase/thioredoxin